MLEAIDIHTHISAPGWPDFEPVWAATTDPLTRSTRVLLSAVETFEGERIVLGRDYPFKPGVDDPGVRRRLLIDNTRDLLRVPVAAPA